MTPARPRRDALLFVLALAVCIALSGCGKKSWPEPSDSEHVFTLVKTTGTLKNDCLFVDATLGGAWENVSRVYLQYAPADCPGCPFTALESIEFIPGQDTTMLANGRLTLQACGLSDSSGYRWKLIVANRHATLRDVSSDVMSTD